MDFPDGSTFTLNRKILSLVAEDEGTAAADATSEHRHVGKRAKTRAPSKEKEDAAEEASEESEEESHKEEDERSDSDYGEEGGEDEEDEHRHARSVRRPDRLRTGRSGQRLRVRARARRPKRQRRRRPVRPLVRYVVRGIPPGRRAHGLPTNTARSTKSNVITHNSNRRHRQGGGLRSIPGYANCLQETGGRKSM